MESQHSWVEVGAFAIEALAVVLIVGFIAVATVVWLFKFIATSDRRVEEYDRYRRRLARSLLIGLEILVAADIVRTVALQPGLNTILQLGLLVVIRTFLSWSIVVEIEGRWPWQVSRVAESKESHI